MRTQRSPMRLRVLTSLGLSSRRRSYSLIAGSIFPFATSFSALAMTLSRWTAIFSVFSGEQQHRFVDPLERPPMNRTRTVELQCGLMPLRRVSPIVREVVDGVDGMIRLHQQIAVDLRHHGSRCNGDASAITLDERDLRHLHALQRDRIEKKDVGTDGEVLDRLLHGQLRSLEDVDAVDGDGLDDADGHGAGPVEDVAADGQAVLEVDDELRIVDAKEGWLGVENDPRGHDRAGQTAAADLVRSGDGAKTKIAEPALDGRKLGNARQLREEPGVKLLGLSLCGALRCAPLSPGGPGGSRASRDGPGHGVPPRSCRSSENTAGTCAPLRCRRRPCAR